MGLDVEYGWHHFWFELHDIEFSTSISFEEKDDEGDWLERDSPSSLFVEPEEAEEIYRKWETNPNVRFGSPSRIIKGTAKFAEDSWGEIRVGIPEDKESWDFKDSKKINGIDLLVREFDDDVIVNLSRRGNFGNYNNSDENNSEEVTYLELYVSSAFFDTIEKTIHQGATKLGIAVQMKCWHWIDPMGHSTLFIDEEKNGLAEISRISGTKSVRDESVEHVFDDPNYDGESVETSNVDVHIFKILSSLETHLINIRNILIAVFVMLVVVAYRLIN